MSTDERWMREALALGESALGLTSPNPPVGAVVLDAHGEIAGRGATAPAGGPHAEVHALREAGARARGGTAVVTLEPCRHTGRTGPCTEALLAAGIVRVVFAVADPDRAAGGGAEVLRAAGIEVRAGVLADECRVAALRWWLGAVALLRPWVVWKYAATLDGRIAAADGTSQWITSPPARAEVHRLRSRIDAVAVGSGTVLADDARLTARDPDGRELTRQPLRVVFDRRGRIPPTARVRDAAADTLVVHDEPAAALATLYGRGVRSVLLEGGPTLAGAFVGAGLVDEIHAHFAPRLLGAGPAALGPAGVTTLADAPAFRVHDVRSVGPDVIVTAVRDATCTTSPADGAPSGLESRPQQ